jgi:hypothetical protein
MLAAPRVSSLFITNLHSVFTFGCVPTRVCVRIGVKNGELVRRKNETLANIMGPLVRQKQNGDVVLCSDA